MPGAKVVAIQLDLPGQLLSTQDSPRRARAAAALPPPQLVLLSLLLLRLRLLLLLPRLLVPLLAQLHRLPSLLSVHSVALFLHSRRLPRLPRALCRCRLCRRVAGQAGAVSRPLRGSRLFEEVAGQAGAVGREVHKVGKAVDDGTAPGGVARVDGGDEAARAQRGHARPAGGGERRGGGGGGARLRRASAVTQPARQGALAQSCGRAWLAGGAEGTPGSIPYVQAPTGQEGLRATKRGLGRREGASAGGAAAPTAPAPEIVPAAVLRVRDPQGDDAAAVPPLQPAPRPERPAWVTGGTGGAHACRTADGCNHTHQAPA